MKLVQRMFLQAVKLGQVSVGATGLVSQQHGNAFQGRPAGYLRQAEKAGHVEPYPQGERSVLRLSKAGEDALDKALAARADAR